MSRLLLRNALLLTTSLLILIMLAGTLSRTVLADVPRHELAYYVRYPLFGQINLLDVRRNLTLPLMRADDIIVDMAWSPGGDALVLNTYSATGLFRLQIMSLVDDSLHTLMRDTVSFRNVQWSPDGRWLSFTRQESQTASVFVVDIESGDARQLSPGSTTNSLAWSPDSKQVAYAARGGEGSFELYIFDVGCFSDGCDPIRHTIDPAIDHMPVWSPDGTRIAFISNRQMFPSVYIIESECEQSRCVPQRVSGHQVNDTPPKWSGDGQWLAFNVSTGGIGSALYVADMQTSAIHRISRLEESDYGLSWSPDSQSVAYVSRFRNALDIVVTDVACAIRAPGCAVAWQRITKADANLWSPVWRP